jgi:hypothetical protein
MNSTNRTDLNFIPNKKGLIFKYAPINEFTFKNLILSQLWFAPPNSMNDQLEGLVRISNPGFQPSKNALQKFILTNSPNDYYWEVENEIKEKGFVKFFVDNWYSFERNRYGISCFSLSHNLQLMWAHYADKHSGLCLIYDKELVHSSFSNQNTTFNYSHINYSKMPVLNLIEKDNEIKYESDIPLITSKDLKWKYEREVRFYSNFESSNYFKGKSLSIYKKALIGVIYGLNMSEEDKDAVSLIIRNEPYYKDVLEFDANLDYETGELYFMKD